MKNILLLFALLPFISFGQQLPYRSVFNETSFTANPAMTSRWDYLEIGATYRQQWMGFSDAPRTATLGMQFPFVEKNMSVGAYIIHDRTDPLKFNAISFSYAYKFGLGIKRDDQLSIGILGSFSEFHIDGSKAIANDLDDTLIPGSESSQIKPNIGAGIYYVSYAESDFDRNLFFLGLAVNQLLGSDLFLTNTTNTYNYKSELHGNALVGFRLVYTGIFLEPSAWINYAASNIVNTNISLKLERKDSFWTGLALSSNSTLSFQAGLILKEGWLKDGTLRIGTLGTYNIGGSPGQYQGFGYEFYAAYRFLQ